MWEGRAKWFNPVIQPRDSNHIRRVFRKLAFIGYTGRGPMKRFGFLAALMLLSSSADAASYSFVVGGHRIRIEAPRHCKSLSCVSLSVPGIIEARRGRDRTDDIGAAPAAAPKPLASVPAQVSAPVTIGLAAAETREVAVPPQPKIQPAEPPQPEPARVEPSQPEPVRIEALPAEPARIETPAATAPPVAEVAPKASTVSQQVDAEAFDTPLGDWRTEAKGMVRIERCGSALCGYVLDPSSRAKGQAVLVNMKPKTGSQWIGSVYSRNSGDTYYGTLAMKGPDTLRVEACVLGRFYCSGNNWSRIDAAARKQITSRQVSPEPRS